MATRSFHRPITSVFTDVLSEVTHLVQTEIRLARAEVSEKVNRAASGGTMIGVGAVFLLAGLFVLLLGIVQLLAIAGLPEHWGLLLVGAAVLIVGVALALKGVNNLKESASAPDRTVEQVRADLSVIKEQVR